MSDKEFFTDWVSEVTETSGDLGAYFSIESATEAAWDHQQSKLDAKDEILGELVKQLNKDVGDMNCIELGRWYAENDKLLNKPEIKVLRGEG